MNYRLCRIISSLITPFAPALIRMKVPDDRREREERMGRYGEDLPADAVWIHAASAGETEAAEPIVAEIARRAPRIPLLFSSMTRAGRRRAGNIPGVSPLYVPVDLPGPVRRAFRRLRPTALLLVETEIWPNLIVEAAGRDCPVAVVNGRISAPAFRRMRRVRPLYREALAHPALFGVQREIDAERFAAFGVPAEKIFVHGSTKVDTPVKEAPDTGLRQSGAERWAVFGSVRSGEEGAVLAAAKAILDRSDNYRVAVAPRHPERAADYLADSRIEWSRWSRGAKRGARAVLVDTVGDLLRFYRMADVAFVGGSLSHHGGHNPLEPARFGVPAVMGPNRENCRELADLLIRAGALVTIDNGNDLAAAFLSLLENDERRRAIGEAGRSVLDKSRGASSRCVDRLWEEGIVTGESG